MKNKGGKYAIIRALERIYRSNEERREKNENDRDYPVGEHELLVAAFRIWKKEEMPATKAISLAGQEIVALYPHEAKEKFGW